MNSGEPFVGKAGQLMNKAFEYIGIERSQVYIANIVKCRPPNNRNPEDDEAMALCTSKGVQEVCIITKKGFAKIVELDELLPHVWLP